jgi:hypothetical protein
LKGEHRAFAVGFQNSQLDALVRRQHAKMALAISPDVTGKTQG